MLSKLMPKNLSARIIVIVLSILAVVVVVNNYVFVSGFKDSAEAAMVEKAGAFTAVADEAKAIASFMVQNEVYKTDELVAEMLSEIEAGKSVSNTRMYKTIPVVVGWTAAAEAAEKEGIEFKVPAFDARNEGNLPKSGSFREELLRDLKNQFKSTSNPVISRIDPDTNKLHYMRSIVLSQDCMMCHGKPGNEFDTDGDGKDVLGFPMESWVVGDMHGAYEVIMPMDDTDAQVASFIGMGAFWSCLLSAAGVGIFIFVLRKLVGNPIGNLLTRLRAIANGDLTGADLDYTSSDEVGELSGAADTMQQSLVDLVSKVQGTANDVAGAATELTATAEQMTTGMKQQTAQTSQVAAAVEEMNATVMEVARKSVDASSTADNAGSQANAGGEVVRETVEAINAISTVVNESAEAVEELGRRGEEIGEVINVINDIADQTNLLALNAAIEAARAGEHGRGFAVVADEVRKLAERTTTATQEVGESIKTIQDETGKAVQRMSEGTERVEQGVVLAEKAGESLQSIVGGSQEVSGMIQSIAAASEQQSAASDTIAQNIEEISNVTRQSSEATEQTTTAAGQLSQKAEELQALVGQFKIN